MAMFSGGPEDESGARDSKPTIHKRESNFPGAAAANCPLCASQGLRTSMELQGTPSPTED